MGTERWIANAPICSTTTAIRQLRDYAFRYDNTSNGIQLVDHNSVIYTSNGLLSTLRPSIWDASRPVQYPNPPPTTSAHRIGRHHPYGVFIFEQPYQVEQRKWNSTKQNKSKIPVALPFKPPKMPYKAPIKPLSSGIKPLRAAAADALQLPEARPINVTSKTEWIIQRAIERKAALDKERKEREEEQEQKRLAAIKAEEKRRKLEAALQEERKRWNLAKLEAEKEEEERRERLRMEEEKIKENERVAEARREERKRKEAQRRKEQEQIEELERLEKAQILQEKARLEKRTRLLAEYQAVEDKSALVHQKWIRLQGRIEIRNHIAESIRYTISERFSAIIAECTDMYSKSIEHVEAFRNDVTSLRLRRPMTTLKNLERTISTLEVEVTAMLRQFERKGKQMRLEIERRQEESKHLQRESEMRIKEYKQAIPEASLDRYTRLSSHVSLLDQQQQEDAAQLAKSSMEHEVWLAERRHEYERDESAALFAAKISSYVGFKSLFRDLEKSFEHTHQAFIGLITATDKKRRSWAGYLQWFEAEYRSGRITTEAVLTTYLPEFGEPVANVIDEYKRGWRGHVLDDMNHIHRIFQYECDYWHWHYEKHMKFRASFAKRAHFARRLRHLLEYRAGGHPDAWAQKIWQDEHTAPWRATIHALELLHEDMGIPEWSPLKPGHPDVDFYTDFDTTRQQHVLQTYGPEFINTRCQVAQVSSELLRMWQSFIDVGGLSDTLVVSRLFQASLGEKEHYRLNYPFKHLGYLQEAVRKSVVAILPSLKAAKNTQRAAAFSSLLDENISFSKLLAELCEITYDISRRKEKSGVLDAASLQNFLCDHLCHLREVKQRSAAKGGRLRPGSKPKLSSTETIRMAERTSKLARVRNVLSDKQSSKLSSTETTRMAERTSQLARVRNDVPSGRQSSKVSPTLQKDAEHDHIVTAQDGPLIRYGPTNFVMPPGSLKMSTPQSTSIVPGQNDTKTPAKTMVTSVTVEKPRTQQQDHTRVKKTHPTKSIFKSAAPLSKNARRKVARKARPNIAKKKEPLEIARKKEQLEGFSFSSDSTPTSNFKLRKFSSEGSTHPFAFLVTIPKRNECAFNIGPNLPGEINDLEEDDDAHEIQHKPLNFQIPKEELRKAMQASKSSEAAFWSHLLYRGPAGEQVTVHYCRSKQTGEKTAQLFLDKPVLGFDIEWKPQASATAGIKNNVSLVQLASEERIALFQLALHKGETADEILPPTLRKILESPNVIKTGVAVSADFTRLTNHLGIQPAGLIELSHLHNLVTHSESDPAKVDRRLVGLTKQVEIHLQLPLSKGKVRTSDWSRLLNHEQCFYAAADAYAGLRLYDALEAKRKAMVPRPPRPEFAELKLPIRLYKSGKLPIGLIRYGSSNASTAKRNESLDEELEQPTLKSKSGVGSGDNLSEDCSLTGGLDLSEEDVENLELASSEEGKEDLTDEASSGGYDQSLRGTLVGRIRLLEYALPIAVDSHPIPDSVESERQHDAGKLRFLHLAEKWARNHVPSSQSQAMNAAVPSWAKSKATTSAFRAYSLWEHHKLEVDEIAKLLRDPPLKEATVNIYIAECLGFEKLDCSDWTKAIKVLDNVPHMASARYKELRKFALAKILEDK